VAVPITVRCPCGATSSAEAGDVVTCTCGRTFDTTQLDPQQLRAAELARRHMQLYTRLGLGIVGLATVCGFFIASWWGAGLALPFSCLVWWKGVQPRWRRRAAADVAAIPTSRIEAQPRPRG
jgi:hypothetical protein